jgi:hypothetical protein
MRFSACGEPFEALSSFSEASEAVPFPKAIYEIASSYERERLTGNKKDRVGTRS